MEMSVWTGTQKEKHRKAVLFFLEPLGRFELPTSSLPSAVEPSSPCCTRLFGSFLSKKDEVAACLFHCFHPHVSPWGSRCGSSGNFCIKEAADRLHRHIRFTVSLSELLRVLSSMKAFCSSLAFDHDTPNLQKSERGPTKRKGVLTWPNDYCRNAAHDFRMQLMNCSMIAC